jgi:glycolate oxidase iron-sulfur subunit
VQTNLADWIRNTPDGQEADAILRSCVHCGFCTATCPTYQLLGDELDGPRGRIYLIKQVLEGGEATPKTQLHLDRCLTCRNCETTCPSGVQYGRLVDIGRKVVDERLEHKGRSAPVRAVRWLLKEGLTSPLFAPAMKLGQAVRPLLPAALKNKVPAKQEAGAWPARTHARKMLMLAGCVQPVMLPNINAATARVLDALGVQVQVIERAHCCGAIRQHMDDHAGALDDARRNIDAWWPALEAGAEAIVINASGCGPMVKEYGHLLRFDPLYAEKAKRVSALAKDVAEVVPALLKTQATTSARVGSDAGAAAVPGFLAQGSAAVPSPPTPLPEGEGTQQPSPSGRGWREAPGRGGDFASPATRPPSSCDMQDATRPAREGAAPERHRVDQKVVFHPPCTLQHGQKIKGVIEPLLNSLGVEVLPFAEPHFCCGSAGTYSVLQADLAYQLRDRKLGHLQSNQPDVILSANIGCITHLQSGTATPVRHWIEWLDERLSSAR